MGCRCPFVVREGELLQRAKLCEQEAVERLLARYRPLVEARARTYGRVAADREDLVQEGMISLYAAVQRYDAQRSRGFAAFAEVCVNRRLITVAQTEQRRQVVPLAHAHSLPATDDYNLLFDGLNLTPLEREVAIAFGQGFSYSEISTRLNCGLKRVDNAMQRIRRKYQAWLDADASL